MVSIASMGHGYPAQKPAQSENPQTELAMNDEDFQDDEQWKSLADIDWDKNRSKSKFVARIAYVVFSKWLTIVTIVQPRYKVVDEKDISPKFQKIL